MAFSLTLSPAAFFFGSNHNVHLPTGIASIVRYRLIATAPRISASPKPRSSPDVIATQDINTSAFGEYLLSQVAFPTYTYTTYNAARPEVSQNFQFDHDSIENLQKVLAPAMSVNSNATPSRLDSLPTELLLAILDELDPVDHFALTFLRSQCPCLASLAVKLAVEFVKNLAPWAKTPLCCFKHNTVWCDTAYQIQCHLTPAEYDSLKFRDWDFDCADVLLISGGNNDLKLKFIQDSNIPREEADASIFQYEWLFPRSKEYVLRNFTSKEYVRGRGKFGLTAKSFSFKDPGLGMVLVSLCLKKWAGHQVQMNAWEDVKEQVEGWTELVNVDGTF